MNQFSKQKSYNIILQVIGVFLFLSFSGCVMAAFRKVIFSSVGYKSLLWNLFLAWIPLIFSAIIAHTYIFTKRSGFRTIRLLIFGVVWVAFYPNSPYIVTDFIHLSGINSYMDAFGYSMNFLLWFDFIMISLLILTGFMIGFVSLYIIQMLLVDRFNRFIGWLFVGGILFLSSFGIYLGRFIRWNSWDLISNPKVLIHGILDNSKQYAIEFTICFGLFLILIYIALYYITRLNEYCRTFTKIGESEATRN